MVLFGANGDETFNFDKGQDMAKQLTIFLENRPGRMKSISDVLLENNLNIWAFTIQDRGEFGLMKLIVTQLGEPPRRGKDRVYEQILERAQRAEGTLLLIFDEAHLLTTESLTMCPLREVVRFQSCDLERLAHARFRVDGLRSVLTSVSKSAVPRWRAL